MKGREPKESNNILQMKMKMQNIIRKNTKKK